MRRYTPLLLALVAVLVGCQQPTAPQDGPAPVTTTRAAGAVATTMVAPLPPGPPDVVEPQPADAYAPATAPAPRTHVVSHGQTLWSIARQHYGDPRQWRRILQANSDRVRDPAHLPAGATLIIP